ncbi:MAG: substrate-binding periplasmic protein [Aestuariibacter sp.]
MLHILQLLAKILVILVLVTSSAVAASTPVQMQAEKLVWMTEEYPPYNFHDGNGRLIGISVDILVEIMRRMDIPFSREDIYVIPWARGYRETLNNPDAALFTMTMSDYRKDLFTFVGPILPSRISVVTVNADYKINSLNDLIGLNVGAVRNDIGEQLLNKHGLAHVAKVKLPTSLEVIRMLLLKRIDAVAIDESIAKYEFNRLGVTKDQFQIRMTLEELTTHFAFNLKVSADFINAFSETFNQLTAEGYTDSVFEKYGVSTK